MKRALLNLAEGEAGRTLSWICDRASFDVPIPAYSTGKGINNNAVGQTQLTRSGPPIVCFKALVITAPRPIKPLAL